MLPVLYKMVQSSLSLQPRFYTNYLSVFLEIWKWVILSFTPAGTYLLKVSNRNTRTRCKICSKLTINRVTPCSSVSIINFEHVFAGWDTILKQNFFAFLLFFTSDIADNIFQNSSYSGNKTSDSLILVFKAQFPIS